MHAGMYPEVPDDFGHWLAGFIDGEGCFWIGRHAKSAYRCMFAVSLRADDLPILEEVCERTGVGWTTKVKRASAGSPAGAAPNVQWRVTNRADLLQLITLLDRYPLRAKKAAEYAIWRQAVLTRPLKFIPRSGVKGGSRVKDWSQTIALRERLQGTRRYKP